VYVTIVFLTWFSKLFDTFQFYAEQQPSYFEVTDKQFSLIDQRFVKIEKWRAKNRTSAVYLGTSELTSWLALPPIVAGKLVLTALLHLARNVARLHGKLAKNLLVAI